ncbi:hypothetical protein EI427_09525 [Flammeovirga pectinis]|uniref:Multidrug transporter n=1 Tax=Flammeovirga pectinis TaxID=2494373 RepID=A0A3Q9FLK0_9BACT|nr:bestrophin family ion channel [Flammeovirga pectinis]AZQ62470.1 hypothetical protein EI427_09525 [Flammeovirga pectinis]
MLIKKYYSIKDMTFWTRHETLLFILIASIPTVAYVIFAQKWLVLPWTPIALVGTAVAFVVGFRNNAVYDRLWEGRKIWGGIVNSSRSFSILVSDTVTNEYANDSNKLSEEELKKERITIIYRHLAWLTALRYAMRTKKQWETFMEHKTNREWASRINIPEFEIDEKEAISEYLSDAELAIVMKAPNKCTVIQKLQSQHLRKLKERGLIWEFSFLALEGHLKDLIALQGKSERIKNFPYPRQYASLNVYFVWIFLLLLPLGIIPEFAKIGQIVAESFPIIGKYFVWFSIPFSTLVSWVFHTMERIGTVGENPFEGSGNDVPISTIARGIEIDIRTCVEEDPENIPKPFEVRLNIQM